MPVGYKTSGAYRTEARNLSHRIKRRLVETDSFKLKELVSKKPKLTPSFHN